MLRKKYQIAALAGLFLMLFTLAPRKARGAGYLIEAKG